MSNQIKIHTCPTCGMTDECDIVLDDKFEAKHNCRSCGSTWKDNGLVMSGGGEPK